MSELVEKLYRRLKVDSNKMDMKPSYASATYDMLNHPVYLTEDECVFCFLHDFNERGHRSTLKVELVEKGGGEKIDVCDSSSTPSTDGIYNSKAKISSPTEDSDNNFSISTSSSILERLKVEQRVVNDGDSIKHEAAALNSFTDGSGFVIGQNFLGKDELKHR